VRGVEKWGRGSKTSPWILTILAKKLFSQFREGKIKFFHFWCPTGIIFGKKPWWSPWKNPSDVHATGEGHGAASPV